MSGLTAAKQRHVSKDMYAPHSQMSTKIMRGECNGKVGKRSFTGLDTAEPKHFLCKEIANERKESLLYISRVQHFLCKDTDKIWFVTVQRQKIRVLKQ